MILHARYLPINLYVWCFSGMMQGNQDKLMSYVFVCLLKSPSKGKRFGHSLRVVGGSDLVNCPTRWPLSLLFGYKLWSYMPQHIDSKRHRLCHSTAIRICNTKHTAKKSKRNCWTTFRLFVLHLQIDRKWLQVMGFGGHGIVLQENTAECSCQS